MNTCDADVVVVGASACGSLAAKAAATNGAKTFLLEEDASPGKFHKCSGLYSKRGLQTLGVDYNPFLVNEIKGANIHAGRHVFTVAKRNAIALVLDRQELDEQLCSDAVASGAELKLNQRITKRTLNGVASVKDEFSFRYLIGADGVASSIAYLYKFPPLGNGNIAMCYEAEFDNCNLAEKDKVDVFLDSKLFPGFFGWIIPSGGKKARIGFGTTKHNAVKNAFEKFFQLPAVKSVKVNNAVKLRDFWHSIPLRVRKKTQFENILLVGDAAGQTKSTTGGGVIFGGQCAMLAGEIAARNCSGNGEKISYEHAWRKKFGSVLKSHRVVRKVFDALPSPLHKLTVLGFDKLWVNKLVQKFGDMDYLVTN
ncbi:MAG: NAD(P)/FAD-dependent oxidoreductase [Candidatus Micrarchaeota archaeon]|nr:NAD(P)/FAD-dependent oxidoreductase [Candidatus Micrarchaeota archaeon]